MIIFRKLWLYYNTLKFLKITQIYFYLLFYLKKNLFNTIFNRQVAELSTIQSPLKCPVHIKPYLKSNHNLSEKSFKFLNKRIKFQNSIGWNDSSLTKLWLYNLHYFDFLLPLCDQDSEEMFGTAKNIVLDWIKSNPVGYHDGWESYPLSLRIVNWIFFYYGNYNSFNRNLDFKQIFLNSLYQQCAYLTRFIEYHIRANHLLKNGKALFFAGYFFDKDDWIEKGQKILVDEIEEQILSDGGHFERSPMYHSIVLEDILDLLNLISAKKIVSGQLSINYLKSIITQMLIWLKKMLQPDNDIPLFGDSAFAIAANFKQLAAYFMEICKEGLNFGIISELESLVSSGYFIFRSSNQYLNIDGGELGVDYQPGHAHCDLFSYEYSFEGMRFIIDSGPGEYLNTDLRQMSRSIYGHNCVVVNRLDQAELWQAFRMGRRVSPESVNKKKKNDDYVFDGTYRNNLSKSSSYLHKRTIRFANGKFFIVIDNIESGRIISIQSLVHIHHNCSIKIIDDALRITQGEKIIYILYKADQFNLKIEDWSYFPEFGIQMKSKRLIIEPEDLKSTTVSYIISPEMYFKDARNYFTTHYSDFNLNNQHL